MVEDSHQFEKLKIKSRESWFKIIILSVFSFVIIILLHRSSFNINLSNLSFTDVLSLLLALFSVGISIAFYFRATETSNEFYNNTYRFTQDASKILERIGEKVNNIEARMPNYPTTTRYFSKIPPEIYKEPDTSDKSNINISK